MSLFYRLRADNDGGSSSWSEEVTYRTLPDRPARPTKPSVKGRIHAHSFRLKWEPPSDTGGAEITEYNLEVNSGSGYKMVYKGPKTEANCDKLTPGTTYQLRVSCITAGGLSNYSDPCTVTTDAIHPSKCANLRSHGKPKPTSITVRWAEPDYNGGAPILEYEIEMISPDSSDPIGYKTKDIEYSILNLQPGCEYSFAVRAVNRIGPGAWSDHLVIISGAAPPDGPTNLTSTLKSPTHAIIQWLEPRNNGAPIKEYRLEMNLANSDDHFLSVYQGPNTLHEVKNLTPATAYYFRVEASNSAGYGPYSNVLGMVTQAAAPSVVAVPQTEVTAGSISLSWTEPINNGSPITHYNIEVGEHTVTTDGPLTKYTIESLESNTSYRVKIQAVNSIGAGTFSPSVKVTTLTPPPPPPKLECIAFAHNYFKLKWGEGRNQDYTVYCLEMESPRTRDFQCIFKGTALTFKVNRLQEMTTYKFRINAKNDAGKGDFSKCYEFTTLVAPPIPIKVLKIIEVEQTKCTLEWAPSKVLGIDPVSYIVQVSRLRDQDYKEVIFVINYLNI